MPEDTFKFNIDPKLYGLLHCPTCKLKFITTDFLDIFVQGFSCKNAHRFFIELQNPLMDASAQCEKMILNDLENNKDEDLIRLWLATNTLREKLNNQLATIMRRIYEIYTASLHIKYDQEIFQYCLLCRDSLKPFEIQGWGQGLKCGSGHEFSERDGVHFMYKGNIVYLRPDMSDENLRFLVSAWLKGDKTLDTNLHPRIKSILSKYKKEYME
jgi:hypothetical protein